MSCPRAGSRGGHCVDQGNFWGPKQAPASLGALRHSRAVELSTLSAQLPHLTKFSISLPFLAQQRWPGSGINWQVGQ